MTLESFLKFIFGRLTFQSFPFIDAIEHPSLSLIIAAGAALIAIFGFIVVVVLITIFGKWGVLWRKWLTTTDHKRIGIMYIVIALVMFARAIIEGSLMRTQQAFGLGGGFLSPEHFAELFSTHGTIMIFFVAMPFVAGFINLIMPLQIGARDVSFPMMNQISLGLTAAGAILLMISLVVGHFSTGGWSGYPPYTGLAFNPGTGPDYWIWAIIIAGIGSTLSGVNFAVTIFKERAPGMTLFRMPLFTWTALATSILLIFAMPPLTVAASMLALDRYLDFHFFTNALGGNMMNFANLFWLFGHPEVYLLVLPAFGVFSEVISTYSGKRLYGYKSLVLATLVILLLSFSVWVHHFFTMGQGTSINIAFGIATMLIAVPTGVKIYDWMATMFRGRVRFRAPIIYATGFLIMFVVGGLSGVILANPSVDFQVHNTLFLVAHFHNVLIPGVLFGMLAGYHFWFPKAFGFRLHEGWGITAAFLWIFGFATTFFPLYGLGLMGMPRRSASFMNPDLEPLMIIAVAGAAILLCAFTCLVIQLVMSIWNREKLRVPLGDPWNGFSLEWSIPSPPPEYNFAVLPQVHEQHTFAAQKERGSAYSTGNQYEDIEVLKNTSMGIVFCVGGIMLGFALVWYIWWLAVFSIFFILIPFIVHAFSTKTEEVIPAKVVAAEHRTWLKKIKDAVPILRDQETKDINEGLAKVEVPNPLSNKAVEPVDQESISREKRRENVLLFGFWTFLMSDLIIFGLMFATYISMFKNTAHGPGPKEVYDLTSVFWQTMFLLTSSCTFGIATLSMRYQESTSKIVTWLVITLIFGVLFLSFEVHDFFNMLSEHAGPSRSGFLTSFFGLVPLHGLHVTAGSLWLIFMIIQIYTFGFIPMVRTRLLRLGIFWHFLDIIWVGIFSIVYLGGVA